MNKIEEIRGDIRFFDEDIEKARDYFGVDGDTLKEVFENAKEEHEKENMGYKFMYNFTNERYYLIEWKKYIDTEVFNKNDYIEQAKIEYLEELEDISEETGYNTLYDAEKDLTDDKIIYKVYWNDKDIESYSIVE